MSGHSKWSQIKHKKAKTDESRGKLFSKLINAIAVAARSNPDPKLNPALRNAIEQAKRNNMPQVNIDRAIKRVGELSDLEELLIEGHGPGGVGIIVQAITNNRNRTMGEIKSVFKKYGVKLGEPGSLSWAFEVVGGDYLPRFGSDVDPETEQSINSLISELDEMSDVKSIFSSLSSPKSQL